MTARSALLLAALPAALLAGCSGRPELSVSPPGPELENPQLPEETTPMRPGPGPEGVYRLVEVNGRVLPAEFETGPGCVLRTVSGSLTIEDGRFAFASTTQESCGEEAGEPVAHHAAGRYDREGSELHLVADTGSAFRAAEARPVGDESLQVVELSGAGLRGTRWTFHREEPRVERESGA